MIDPLMVTCTSSKMQPIRDLVSKVGQIVVDLRGVRGKEGGEQQRAASYQAP